MNKDHYWYAIPGLEAGVGRLAGDIKRLIYRERGRIPPLAKISTHAWIVRWCADRFRFNFRLLYENHNLVGTLVPFLPCSWKISAKRRDFRIGDNDSINGMLILICTMVDWYPVEGGEGLTSSRQRIIGVKRLSLWTEMLEGISRFFFSRLIIGREEMKVKVCNYNYNKV